MQERPSVKKLLAYEKEVNEALCQDGLGSIEFRRHTQPPKERMWRNLSRNESLRRFSTVNFSMPAPHALP